MAGKKVSASNTLIPHLEGAAQVFLFPEGDDPELILLYLRPGKFNNWPLPPGWFLEEAIHLLRRGVWRVQVFDGGTLFLEK